MAGNVGIAQLVTSPSNFAVTINPDGTIDVASGGNTSRQRLLYGRYILATNALDPPTFPAATGVVWINEVAPVWNAAVILPSFASGPIIVGQPILPVTLQSATYAVSPPGDTLTFALASGSLPPGLSLVGNQIAGTPTSAVTTFFTISATDITGTSTVSAQCSISVSIPGVPTLVPNVEQLPQAQAVAVLNAAGFTNITFSTLYSVVTPSGDVAVQNPPAGTVYLSGNTITLSVSIGNYIPAPNQNLGYKVTVRQFSLEELVSREWGSEYKAPDHRIYEWSNGRRFDSTDIGTTGIYQRPGNSPP